MQSSSNLTAASVAQTLDRPTIAVELGCADDTCLLHIAQEFLTHPTWFCDGGANIYEGGSRVGHWLPGTIMVVWAAHWVLGLVRSHYESQARGEPFRSQSCYRVLWLPERWPLEAAIKATLPFVAILMELWLMHSTYRRMFCPSEGRDSARAGHLVGNHVNNWQHASLYPGFIISGIVDLVSLAVDLPSGTTQAFLSLSFLHEGLLLGLHKKHAALDVLIHQLLSLTALLCAAFAAAEVAWPHNPLLVAGRAATACLHGCWLIEAAHIIFDSHPTWDTLRDSDIAPVLYGPVLFISLVMAVMLGITAAFGIGYAVYLPRLRMQRGHGGKSAAAEEDEEHGGVLPMSGAASDVWRLQYGEHASWTGPSGLGLLG